MGISHAAAPTASPLTPVHATYIFDHGWIPPIMSVLHDKQILRNEIPHVGEELMFMAMERYCIFSALFPTMEKSCTRAKKKVELPSAPMGLSRRKSVSLEVPHYVVLLGLTVREQWILIPHNRSTDYISRNGTAVFLGHSLYAVGPLR